MRVLLWTILAGAALAAAAAPHHADILNLAPDKSAKQQNPYAGQPRHELAGRKLYLEECAACHGKQAEGRGKIPPLSSPMVHAAAPGALFWVLTNGSLRHGMPSFASLPRQQRWQIVTYLKSGQFK